MISKPKNFGIQRRRRVALENLERRLNGEPIAGKVAVLDDESRARCEAEAETLRKRLKL
jgi:hypothetical protein